MRADVVESAKMCEVIPVFSGKRAVYTVKSVTGQAYSVLLQAGCDCEFVGKQGAANGEVCSHVIAVLMHVSERGGLKSFFQGQKDVLQAKRNEALSLVKESNRKVNEVRFGASEGARHVAMKLRICQDLVAEGKQFVTEAIFKNGGRADVYVLDSFVALEIADSESEESIEKKKETYPEGVKVVSVRI